MGMGGDATNKGIIDRDGEKKINVNAKEHFRLTDMNIKLIQDIKRRLAKCYTYLLRVRF